jgi:hypothetical protein
MDGVSFASVNLQLVPVGGGSMEIVASALLTGADGRALSDALAWQRTHDHQVVALDTVEAVLAYRSLAALVDEIEAVAGSSPGGPITLTAAQTKLLAEAACRYAAARDREDEHVPARERERIDRLRALGGPLFELVSRFAEAEEAERGSGLVGP